MKRGDSDDMKEEIKKLEEAKKKKTVRNFGRYEQKRKQRN